MRSDGGTHIVQESDNQLKRYLLGELEEPEEEQLELRLLTDPDYARQFDLAVDEIVDRYVAGKFTGAELKRVRDYFFNSKERLEKLRFALALKEQKSRRSSRKESPTRRYTPYLAVAASLVAVLGIGFFAWRALQPEPDLNDGLVALQKAFGEERPIEGRLSDFNYVPLPNQRGGATRVDHVQRDLAGALLMKARRDQPTAASHQAAGKYYLLVHQFTEAEKELNAALALDPNNARIHNDLATVFLEECRTQGKQEGTALEFCGRSLEHLQKALELDNTLLEALFNRALLLQLMGSSPQAIDAWKEYLQKDNSSQWAEEARKNLKQLEQQQQRGVSRNSDDRFQLFLQAKRSADASAAWTIISGTYTSAGNEITNRLLDSLLELEPSTRNTDTAELWPALSYIAQLENNRSGDQFTSDLVSYYRGALPALKPLLINARHHMRTGYRSFEQSNVKDAIREYTKAKAGYEQANDETGKAFVEYRLAHCYVLLPDPEKARLAFNRLLAICETKKYRWLMAQCLFGLAHASADASEYSRAIDYSGRALAGFEQIGDVNGILKSLTQLADFHEAVNRVSNALAYLSRARTLAGSVNAEPKQYWGILNQIGFSMAALQLDAAALFYQKEALRLATEMSIPLFISRSYSYVGSAYAAMKMYPQAVSKATRAFEIGRSIRDHSTGLEMMAQASKQLGDIYREAGKCDEALAHYDHSLQLYRDLKFDYHAYVAHKGKLNCFLASSNNQAVRDELLTVLQLSESYRKKITVESQRNSFFDAEQEVYDLAIDYEFSVEKNYVKGLEYSEKSRARALLDAVERGRRKGNASSRSSAIPTSSLTVAEIQKRMPNNSQIVQFAVLNNKLTVWVVTPTEIQRAEVPITAEALSTKVNDFLDTVNRPPTAGPYKPNRGTELYQILIAPIERHLDQGRFLLIVPDKILNYVPFAALTSPATSRYLIEDFDLGAAASATLFVNLSAAAQGKSGTRDERLLSVGNPRFDGALFKSLRDLPSSADESEAVARLYTKPKLLLREQAIESTIQSELAQADVAHLAMHFVVNEQSEMLSGFPLSPAHANGGIAEKFDGFLQSYEISRLNLSRMRLAVLSACQTGIEKQYGGEGAVGAARPFFIAGVPTVVASLWPVDSDATAELMVNFHRHRLGQLPAAQALCAAQNKMIHNNNPLYRHPYYWASFVATGGLTTY